MRSRYFLHVFTFLFYNSHCTKPCLDPDLPESLLPYYFNNFSEELINCQNQSQFTDIEIDGKCWGYETNCKNYSRYSGPVCPESHKGWVKTKVEQMDTFYAQGDFGYVREQISSMKVMCEPLFKEDSALECSKYLQFCRGRNIIMNFTTLNRFPNPVRYKMDILNEGDIGGYCKYYKERLMNETSHMSPLQSWSPELQHFTQMNERPLTSDICNVTLHKPTFIMKIDATVNMYHHMCDFLNLYASLHLNSTIPTMFSTDNHVIIWETYPYQSSFSELFQAFTDKPVLNLKMFEGKTVCFKNVVFPLLPRMIFGLFYNTPLIYGCENSGLFHSFSNFILHRLNINLFERNDKKIRITFLSRETKYRNVINENELLSELKKIPRYLVRRAVYNRNMSFKDQLETTRNTDVFVGMHGAGLTHLMFLPDWAGIFELYHCEDENCYFDLARLRGVKYVTWRRPDKMSHSGDGHHPNGGHHAKFTNYSFNVEEFVNVINELAEYVSQHPKYLEFTKHINHDEL